MAKKASKKSAPKVQKVVPQSVTPAKQETKAPVKKSGKPKDRPDNSIRPFGVSESIDKRQELETQILGESKDLSDTSDTETESLPVEETSDELEDLIEGTEVEETSEDEAEITTEVVEEDSEVEEKIDELLDEGEEKESENDDLSEYLDEAPKKSGEQKRIDKLTRDKYELQERLERLEHKLDEKISEPTTKGEKKYSDNELKQAMRKAFDDGDSDLAWEIVDYKIRQERESAEEKYERLGKDQQESEQRRRKEWLSVQEEYSKYGASSEPEFYAGSSKDLNIADPQSLLNRLASSLYFSKDEELKVKYQSAGGMHLAVSDAFRLILAKKRGSMADNTETAKLKKKLAKERRKKSTAGSTSQKTDSVKTPARPKTNKELLDDEIARRHDLRTKRSAGFFGT